MNDPVLQVSDLTYRYPDGQPALQGVDLELRRGERVALLGPNGAGKTTTMRAIMGLVALDGGAVAWNGGRVDSAVRRRFGYMPAERGMYQRMKVREHLAYYAKLSGLGGAAGHAADTWLERLGLAARGGDTVQSLSSGNQQRVQLALALINEPDLLVLDEPFSGLDPIAVETLSDVLREQVARGAALLLSSHQLDLVADVCSAVVIVDHGRVVLHGDVAQLRASSATRYVEVEYAVPTSSPWVAHDGVSVLAGGRRHRIAVTDGTDPAGLLAEARALGVLLGYSFSPPDLSEVFLDVVGGSK